MPDLVSRDSSFLEINLKKNGRAPPCFLFLKFPKSSYSECPDVILQNVMTKKLGTTSSVNTTTKLMLIPQNKSENICEGFTYLYSWNFHRADYPRRNRRPRYDNKFCPIPSVNPSTKLLLLTARNHTDGGRGFYDPGVENNATTGSATHGSCEQAPPNLSDRRDFAMIRKGVLQSTDAVSFICPVHVAFVCPPCPRMRMVPCTALASPSAPETHNFLRIYTASGFYQSLAVAPGLVERLWDFWLV